MSQTDHYKGRLIPTGKNLEEFLEDKEMPGYYGKDDQEACLEYFYNEFYDEKIIIKGMIYDIEKKSFCYDDIFSAVKNDFEVKYYNGGCGFQEAILRGLENEN